MSETETEKKTKPKSLKEQMEARKIAAIQQSAITFIRANSHLTLEKIFDLVKDDEHLAEVLTTTSLRELVGDGSGEEGAAEEAEAAPSNGTNGHAKRNGKKKKAPPRVGKAAKTAKAKTGKAPKGKSDAQTLQAFLDSIDHGAEFKTADYAEAAGVSSQTALNHLAKCKDVKKKGERRNMVWVAK